MALINKIGNILKETSRNLPGLESSIPYATLTQAIRCFSSKLFIGGLSFGTDENSLREAFVPYGDVIEARIIFDRESGRSRGFGFVSYASAEEASAAIQALDGRDLHGRFLRVAHAADQRRTTRDQKFSGAAGYDESYKSEGYGYGGATYATDNVLKNGPPDNFKTHDISNEANGNYLHNTPNNFGGGPAGNYGAGIAGGSFGNDSYGSTGNFSSDCYSNGNADGYNASNGGANIFDIGMPYNSVRQDNGYCQQGHKTHNLESNNYINDEDGTKGTMDGNVYANPRIG